MTDITPVALRLPTEIVTAIDARRTQIEEATGSMPSRNEWITKALGWVLNSLPTHCEPARAHFAAYHAPFEVAGTKPTLAQAKDAK